MKKLYRYIDIPDWQVMSNELRQFADFDKINPLKSSSWRVYKEQVKARAPILYSFLERSKLGYELKYYAVPPSEILGYHIDGFIPPFEGIQSPKFSLNFPVWNTDGTYTHWYDCEVSNLKPIEKMGAKGTYVQDGYVAYALIPIDKEKLVEIDKAETTQPIVIKTDIMHSASNPTDKMRVIASVRFGMLGKSDYNELEDLFDTTGLRIDSRD